ncbi:MAG: ABC transporter permease [Vicinamibacterales bacterium]
MPRPPRISRAVLARLLGAGAVGRSVLGDLDEEYRDRAVLDRHAARRWYRREALGVAAHARRISRGDVVRGRALRRTHHGTMTRGDSMTGRIWQDVRGAVRRLWSQPRFTFVAAVTIALGIGAATSIFSVVNSVLLRPLPFPQADRLVNVWSHAPGLGYDQFPLSPDIYDAFRRHNDVFDAMAIYQNRRANLTQVETPQVVDLARVSSTYFPTLGVSLARGRSFTEAEDTAGGPQVAVVSHRLWTRVLGAREDVLGQTLRVDGVAREIVGVGPEWLDIRNSADVWVPIQFDPAQIPTGSFTWNVIARLKPGVAPDAASAHLEPLVQRAMEENDATPTYRAFMNDGRYQPMVHDLKEDIVGDVRQPLWVLLGTVGIVLLIACANVANLMLIRAEARQQEIAVRVALGSSRATLVRQLLTEAGVLAALGAVLGVGASAVLLPVLLQLAPPGVPRLDRIGLEPVVLVFAAAVAAASALAFGLAPAIRYTRPSMLASLRQGGRRGTEGPAQRRARQSLVVAQTALALVLLVGSGLMLRSFARLLQIDLGFRAEDAMTLRLALPTTDYADGARLARAEDDLVARLAALPGVQAAAAATVLPIESGAPGTAYEFEGQVLAPGELPPMVHYKTVTAGYFDAMRMPVLRGRGFDTRDLQDGVNSVLVNETLAAQHWPGQDPVGKRLRTTSNGTPSPWITVIGVVGDVRQDGLRQPVRGLLYFPLTAASNQPVLRYVIRGDRIADRMDLVRQAVWDVDPNLPIAGVRSLQSIVDDSVVEFTFTMTTLAVAAGLALVLGAIGLYGVLSYAVSLRTREIGVRLALGAPPATVRWTVLANGLGITLVGLVIGLAAAAGLTRLLAGILYDVEPIDPLTFSAMSVALVLVAAVASWLPAHRASRVSPLESLRAE